MSVPDVERKLPWPDSLGYATIRAKIMLAYADTKDRDEMPDAHAPVGTVTFSYGSSGGYRYKDRTGSRLIAPLDVVCPILADGTLGSPDSQTLRDGKVVLMPTDAEGLEPAGSTITAQIRLQDSRTQIPAIVFTARAGDELDLADLVSVRAMPGIVTVVDDTIAVRAEKAAQRAEEAVSGAGGVLTKVERATQAAQELAGSIQGTVEQVEQAKTAVVDASRVAASARDDTEGAAGRAEVAARQAMEQAQAARSVRDGLAGATRDAVEQATSQARSYAGQAGESASRASESAAGAKASEEYVRQAISEHGGIPGTPGKDGAPGEPGKDGDPGPAGKDGEQGPPGTPGKDGRGIVRIENAFYGSSTVMVSYTDGSSDTFQLPEGARGPKGEDGKPGPAGRGIRSIHKPPYVDYMTVMYTDNHSETVQLPKGEAGPRGEPGKDGTPGKDGRGIRSIHKPSYGDFAVVEYTDGDSETFQLPKGDTGPRGEPGTPGERGAPGEPGRDGDRGQQGPRGEPGRNVLNTRTSREMSLWVGSQADYDRAYSKDPDTLYLITE